jgi:hypothetical protein
MSKETIMEKKIVNIEDFYTEVNEREGVWHEPIIDNIPCGLEFLLIGIHCEEAIKKMDELDEKSKAIRESEESDEQKDIKLRELDALRVAVLTKGIRSADGAELMMDGKPFKFSEENATQLFLNSPDLKMDCVDFVLKSSNFIKR